MAGKRDGQLRFRSGVVVVESEGRYGVQSEMMQEQSLENGRDAIGWVPAV